MKHVKLIGIKFMVTFVIVLSIFGIFDQMPIIHLLWISILTTAISYIVGDLLIFRWFGNVTALLVDAVLAFFTFWFLGTVFIGRADGMLPLAFLAAFFFLCSELFLHGYMLHLFSEEESRDLATLKKLQVEFADETDTEWEPEHPKNK